MKKSIDENLKELEGINTIGLVAKKLNVKKSTAIKKICELKKLGYVETQGGGKQPRLYTVSRTKIISIGNPGLYGIINKYSKIKLVTSFNHRIIGRELSIEEAIVRAIKSKEFRVILASLGLFNKIKNWHKLYHFAEKENVRRKVGALYDLSRETIKVRRMDSKTRNLLLNAKQEEKYIIENMKSKDFKDIEKTWKVYIPFNKADLERYKE